jgi:hypothetical protein
MPLASQRKKQIALRDAIATAAARHRDGLTLETHHRLAAEFNIVSPRVRDNVMGRPAYYCEVLPDTASTGASNTAGTAQSVAHSFEVWLAFEYEESDGYEGSTQETFDQLCEGLAPNGILPELRGRSVETIGGKPVTFLDPEGPDFDIIPLGERGGDFDRAHRLTFTIALTEPS